MKNPLVIDKCRSRLVYSGSCIRMDFDGHGLVMELTPDEMEVLGLTLWVRGRKIKRERKCQSGGG